MRLNHQSWNERSAMSIETRRQSMSSWTLQGFKKAKTICMCHFPALYKVSKMLKLYPCDCNWPWRDRSRLLNSELFRQKIRLYHQSCKEKLAKSIESRWRSMFCTLQDSLKLKGNIISMCQYPPARSQKAITMLMWL